MSDFRRRLMMGVSVNPPLYPDNYVDDGWIWAYYNVTTTEEPTTLVYTDLSYLGANFIIDGETVARTASYTFSTTGEHLVKMQRSGALRTSHFRALSALVRMYLPSTVTGIGTLAFYSCANLTHVWLPNSITSINNQSFQHCTSLKVINVDNTRITSVAGSANYGTYEGDTSLRKVTLPTTVTAINTRAFRDCTSLTKINLSELTSLTTIGQLTFHNTALKGVIVLPASLTTLTNQSFQSCKSITEVDLGNTQVATIPGSNNYGCFGACSNLAKVTLPSTLTTLAQRAFYQCYALETVICKAVTPPTISSQSLPGTSYVQHIYVPAESVDTYKAASGWSSYAAKIEAIPTT